MNLFYFLSFVIPTECSCSVAKFEDAYTMRPPGGSTQGPSDGDGDGDGEEEIGLTQKFCGEKNVQTLYRIQFCFISSLEGKIPPLKRRDPFSTSRTRLGSKFRRPPTEQQQQQQGEHEIQKIRKVHLNKIAFCLWEMV